MAQSFALWQSIDSTRERLALQRYLDSIEKADEEQQVSIDPSAVQTALEKLKQHPEPEASFMLVRQTALPAYNVQTAVDAEHALIVAHAVVLDAPDIRCLKPMAEAAKRALEVDSFQVVADAGYSNGEQVAPCTSNISEPKQRAIEMPFFECLGGLRRKVDSNDDRL